MKIVQSFWTKPFLSAGKGMPGSRLNGGWPEKKFNYYSWALSCLQLRKYYSNIQLVTDDLGKELLVDKMQLPYTSVTTTLNQLDKYNSNLWAIGKILAYAGHHEPFLHVDGDIFIWRAFNDRVASLNLVAQNVESKIYRNNDLLTYVCNNFASIPPYFSYALDSTAPPLCINAGIIGGVNHAFFDKYKSEVFRFIDANHDLIERNISNINGEELAFLYEQILFHALALHCDQEIGYLFPNISEYPLNIGFFYGARFNQGYVHCIGSFKFNRITCHILEMRLKEIYPSFYHRINDLLTKCEI
jgi:hypothetical protein